MIRVGIVALLVSLALNGYLLLRSAPPAASSSTPPSAAAKPRGDVAKRSAVPPQLVPIDQLDDAALAQRLAEIEQRIADLQPMEKRYALAARTMETEAVIEPLLRNVFEPKSHAVECRGRICFIHGMLDEKSVDAIQTLTPERFLYGEMMFSQDGTYAELVPVEQRGTQIAKGIERSLLTMPESRACIERLSATGRIEILVDYIVATRRFSINPTGALVGHPLTACLVEALERRLASFVVPPGTPPIPQAHIALDVPRPDPPS